jgi:hypothetical protein
MTTLILGVIDVPYGPAPSSGSRRHKRRGTKRAPPSTGDVAEFLENQYHIMEVFYRQHEDDINEALGNSLERAIENMAAGAPLSIDAFGSATSKIEDKFKAFISNREMEQLGYPGVPTEAAKRGVSHRMARPYKRRAPRPSFLDTGQYMASMKAWVE